ncbi:MAG: UDP-N-acetylmuramate:L-alanyl-gamma-D-glutamyl-meso-diaminopimelate ligase [Deltaproteobacteria bacterium]|nr:UDP-N-acetylmuramate:L-alanyl-gamma-D-glutamyl-meso-diaminopimelate ligase [Deltaproteobacteria bacterium]
MKIHLIGICGTGMASLAGMLKASGHEVQGSDQNVYPPMSTILEQAGIPIFSPYSADHLKSTPDLVVVGNAISRGNPEAEEVLAKGIPHISMPQALARFFLEGKTPLVVAGTHGKTTTASLLAWVLESAGKDPGFFIGGLPKNFGSNFKLGGGEYFVLEGDEYDTAFFDKGPKFLHYRPRHVLLTSVEFDHADIYTDLEHVKSAFRRLLGILPADGSLVANLDFPVVAELVRDFSHRSITYAMTPELHDRADYFGEILATGERTSFCIASSEHGKECCHHEVSWEMPGAHNVSNALGVVALCLNLGLSWQEVRQGLTTFQGVKRRQDVLGEIGGVLVIDDFAHHPTAVKETVSAVRKKYPGRRLWAIFEPRSNSSKRDVFQEDYPAAFAEADRILLADVFMPEKVKSGKVLDVDAVVAAVNRSAPEPKARHISGVEAMVADLAEESRPGDVLLFMSNGGFGGIHQKILQALRNKTT